MGHRKELSAHRNVNMSPRGSVELHCRRAIDWISGTVVIRCLWHIYGQTGVR